MSKLQTIKQIIENADCLEIEDLEIFIKKKVILEEDLIKFFDSLNTNPKERGIHKLVVDSIIKEIDGN